MERHLFELVLQQALDEAYGPHQFRQDCNTVSGIGVKLPARDYSWLPPRKNVVLTDRTWTY